MGKRVTLALVLGLCGWVAASGQTPEFDGAWDILAQYEFSRGTGDTAPSNLICKYQGTAQISAGSGPVNLALTSTEPMGQADQCESALNGVATVESSSGTSVAGSIAGAGQLGSATFMGEPAAARAAAPPNAVQNGTVAQRSGPLSNATGAFSATRVPMMPTLPPAAVGALLFLLVAGGGLLLVRRRVAP